VPARPPSAHGISPDIAIGMGVRVKTPGEQMTGSDVELTLTEQAADDRPPYQRLLGDAMRGLTELFTRQDVVEAQWRAVDPILGNVTPVHPMSRDVGSGEAAISSPATQRGLIPRCKKKTRKS